MIPTDSHKTHFVFDVDDTLTDSYGFNQGIFVQVFIDLLGITDPETITYLKNLHYVSKGTGMYHQFKEAVEYLDLKIDPQELVAYNDSLQLSRINEIQLFDAVVEIMRSLKSAGKDVSICTNRKTVSLSKILETHQITDIFNNIVSCTDAGFEKPNPHCLIKLIEKSGKPKDEFIYFGDSKTDYLFASGAGIDFIIIDHYLNEKRFYKMVLRAFANLP